MLKCPEFRTHYQSYCSEPYANYENVKWVKFSKGIKRVNKSLGAEVKDGGRLHALKTFTKTQPEDKKKKKC